MLLIVLPKAPHSPEHHVGSLIADGAVGGIGYDLGSALNQVDGLQRSGAVQHLLDQDGQLVQPHPQGTHLPQVWAWHSRKKFRDMSTGHRPEELALILRSMSRLSHERTVWARPGVSMDNRLKGISSFTSSRCSAKHSFLVFHSSAKSFCFPAFFLPRLQKS